MLRKLIAATLTSVIVLVAVWGALSGSSDLEVGQITADNNIYPAGAIPYALPLKRLIISTTTKIVDCEQTRDGEALHAVTTAEVTDRLEADESQRYYILYRSKSRGKSVDFSVESYPNGTLKSFSGAIRDEVAPLTEAAAGALLPLLARSLPVSLAAPPPPRELPPPNCRDLADLLRKNKDDPRLLIRQERVWTPVLDGNLKYTVDVPLDLLSVQFGLTRPYWVRTPAILTLAWKQMASGDVAFSAPVQTMEGNTPKVTPALAKGLILRNPVETALAISVCGEVCARLSSKNGSPGDGLVDLPSIKKSIPQFGARFLVPLHSGYAQNATLDAVLDEEGLVTKLKSTTQSALASNVKALSAIASDSAATK